MKVDDVCGLEMDDTGWLGAGMVVDGLEGVSLGLKVLVEGEVDGKNGVVVVVAEGERKFGYSKQREGFARWNGMFSLGRIAFVTLYCKISLNKELSKTHPKTS